MLLDYRAWLSPDKAFEHEHPPDSSSTMSPPRWSAEGLRGRDISLPAHECVLSKHLVPHLEDLMRSGVGVQTAVDILDRVRAHSGGHNAQCTNAHDRLCSTRILPIPRTDRVFGDFDDGAESLPYYRPRSSRSVFAPFS
jgi:hypothetical protein